MLRAPGRTDHVERNPASRVLLPASADLLAVECRRDVAPGVRQVDAHRDDALHLVQQRGQETRDQGG